jgi:hypothetical protein
MAAAPEPGPSEPFPFDPGERIALSVLFVVRIHGVSEGHEPLSVFDTGKHYSKVAIGSVSADLERYEPENDPKLDPSGDVDRPLSKSTVR